MSISNLIFTRDWTNHTDFPTKESSEEKVRYDLQFLHNAVRDYINNTIVPSINEILDVIGDGVTFSVPDGSITTAKLANSAVTNAKLATNAVGSGNIASGAVGTSKIEDGAITPAKLSTASGAQAVSTAAIQDDAVTTVKIADNAVNLDKIADYAVRERHFGNYQVPTRALANKAVTDEKIADNTITAGKIASGVIPEPASNAATSLGTNAGRGNSTKYAREDHVHPHDLPGGGSTGQVLTKSSNTGYDVAWTSPASVPSAYTSNPAALGSASPGSGTAYARGNHVHPLPSLSTLGIKIGNKTPTTSTISEGQLYFKYS